MTSWLISYGFKKSLVDPGVFVVFIEKLIYIMAQYVDDSLLTGKAGKFFPDFKTSFSERLELEDLGPASWLLWCKIDRDREKRILRLNQEHYVSEINIRFDIGAEESIGVESIASDALGLATRGSIHKFLHLLLLGRMERQLGLAAFHLL